MRARIPDRNYPPSNQWKKRKKKKTIKSDNFGKPIRLFQWSAVWFQDCFNSLDKIVTAFGQRVFRCPAPPLLYWSFKCNVELLHLQRCFSTQYKIPHHPSPPANQSTSSRSRRNKAIPFTHRPNHSSPIYNVVSHPFAINLVASPVVVAHRSSLEKN